MSGKAAAQFPGLSASFDDSGSASTEGGSRDLEGEQAAIQSLRRAMAEGQRGHSCA